MIALFFGNNERANRTDELFNQGCANKYSESKKYSYKEIFL